MGIKYHKDDYLKSLLKGYEKLNYLIKGLVYKDSIRQSFLQEAQASKAELFRSLEFFLTDIHNVIREEQEADGHDYSHLQKQIIVFEEEVMRFLSILPI